MAGLWVGALGCGAPAPPPGTGGVTVEPGRCGRGLVVASSDYQSTNLSLLGTTGEVLSASFLSSASASTGLSAPLSGDVVVPTAPSAEEIVWIDRAAAVVGFASVTTAEVRAQLDVSTGFASNPQDYLDLGGGKAYVSRYQTNGSPGREPFDGGGDLLIVDPAGPAITGRVALPSPGSGYFPHPSRLLAHGGRVLVLDSAFNWSFTDSTASRVLMVDPLTDQVESVAVLTGVHGCSGFALGPGDRLAVSCSGKWDGSQASIGESAIVVLSLAGGEPTEIGRFAAADLVAQPLGFSLAFATPTTLLATAMGAFDGAGQTLRPDVAFELDLDREHVRGLVRTQDLPFELGEVRCLDPVEGGAERDPRGCGSCFVADGERGVVHRLTAGPAGLELGEAVDPDPRIGLPPRTLGRF